MPCVPVSAFRVGAGLDGGAGARPALFGTARYSQGGSSPHAALQTRPYPKPRGRWAVLALLFLLLPLPAGAYHPYDRKVTQEERDAIARLPEKYRAWIEEVDVLIGEEERATFLALEKDYQRDAFIKRFWEVRDPLPRTARNELRERWDVSVRQARELFQDLSDGRSRVLLLNGAPDERVESDCSLILWPLEVWFYPGGSDQLKEPFSVVLYRRWGAGPFRVWAPHEGIDVLFADSVLATGGQSAPAAASGAGSRPGRDGGGGRGASQTGGGSGAGSGGHSLSEITAFTGGCGPWEHAQKIAAGIVSVFANGQRWDLLELKIVARQEGPGREWVSSFNSYSTDVPENAAPLAGRLDLAFPGRFQSRTMVQGIVTVPADAPGQAALGEARAVNLLLTGEVLRDGELFDSFRYKFDFPISEGIEPGAESIPLTFERPLRPGDYTLIVKVEDVNSGKFFREERAVSVPQIDVTAPAPMTARLGEDAETTRILAEANAALRSGETTIHLVPPAGQLQTGMQRFDTLITGTGIEKVTFSLDGKPVLTKKGAPYSVELDLGNVPRTRTLAVAAFDAAGNELAGHELLLNSAGHRFRVHLTEPRKGKRYESSLLAKAEVEVPEGETAEKVELYLNETRIATLYQPPYVHPVVLPKDAPIAYVRAVAYLPDGNTTEHVVFVNAPEYLEEVDVDLVELYTTVLDRQGRPVTSGLEAQDFTVTEDGAKQKIVRFERVTDLPIHAAVAIDVSASMEKNLEKAQAAALQFLQGTVRPRDRAAVVTFNDHPTLAVKFTRDVKTLAGGLAGLKAERGTALYDSLIFTFYNFNGLRGRRAILLLSDGKDEGSRFTWEETLEFARRAGVTVYAIGLGEEVEKKKLARISEETGGRAFFPRDADELAGIYATIQEELRSQYLIAYQSSTTRTDPGFRVVDLKVGKSGLEAKTLRGYYP